MNKFKNRGKENSFIESYSFLNSVAYYGSWLGNLADIVLMFFFVYPTLLEMGDVKSKFLKVIFLIATGILLFIFEVVKRTTIYEMIAEWLSSKDISTKLKILAFSFICIIGATGFMAISGTQEIAFKKVAVVETIKKNSNDKVDNLKTSLKIEREKVESKYKPLKKNSEAWVQKYQEVIEKEKSELDDLDKKFEKDKSEIKEETVSTSADKIEAGEEVLIKAMIITIIIELIIILGVAFNCKFDYEEFMFEKRKDERAIIERNKKIKEIRESPEFENYSKEIGLLIALYKSCYKGLGTIVPKYEIIKSLLFKNIKDGENPKKKEFETFKEYLRQNNILTGNGLQIKFIKNLNDARVIMRDLYGYQILDEENTN